MPLEISNYQDAPGRTHELITMSKDADPLTKESGFAGLHRLHSQHPDELTEALKNTHLSVEDVLTWNDRIKNNR